MNRFSKIVGIATASALLTTPLLCHGQSWSPNEDFDIGSNPNGPWSYGSYRMYGALGLDVLTGNQSFVQRLEFQRGDSYALWGPPSGEADATILHFSGDDSLVLIAGNHPGTAFFAPVVRWTAPTNGTYLVEAKFDYSGLGAATTHVSQAGIIVEEQVVSYTYIGGQDGSLRFGQQISLKAGDRIDFFVAKGQHAIALTGSVSAVPEPSSLMAWLFGIAMLIGFRDGHIQCVSRQRH